MAKEVTCEACNNHRYIIALRDDGRKAIEACDSCASHILPDDKAAAIARWDGIDCNETYPCYLKDQSYNPDL